MRWLLIIIIIIMRMEGIKKVVILENGSSSSSSAAVSSSGDGKPPNPIITPKSYLRSTSINKSLVRHPSLVSLFIFYIVSRSYFHRFPIKFPLFLIELPFSFFFLS